MKRIILTTAATLALSAGQTALADVHVGISIGVPGVIYTAPRYYYERPPRHVHRPHVVVVPQPIYVPGPQWVVSERRPPGHSRAGPPGHRGKHWHKHHRGHGHGHGH